jgi:hypothetical protein
VGGGGGKSATASSGLARPKSIVTALQIRKRMVRIWRGEKYRVEAVAGYTHKIISLWLQEIKLAGCGPNRAPPRGA